MSVSTPFELWQAGQGPEPVVTPVLPAEPAFMPPWKWRYLEDWYADPVTWCRAHEARERATAEAAEELRAALEAAIICLPDFGYPFSCPYDQQQCEYPRCLADAGECAKRRAMAAPRRRPCAH